MTHTERRPLFQLNLIAFAAIQTAGLETDAAAAAVDLPSASNLFASHGTAFIRGLEQLCYFGADSANCRSAVSAELHFGALSFPVSPVAKQPQQPQGQYNSRS